MFFNTFKERKKVMFRQRYIPNAAYAGRKERDGFVCSSGTYWGQWCVAVKLRSKDVQIRDTKDPHDKTLTFTTEEWNAFIEGAKQGEFDLV